MAPYAPEISHLVWANNVTSGQALRSAERLKSAAVLSESCPANLQALVAGSRCWHLARLSHFMMIQRN